MSFTIIASSTRTPALLRSGSQSSKQYLMLTRHLSLIFSVNMYRNTYKCYYWQLPLGRVATSPSANIFTSREHEMLLRSLNLRRLALVLFTGEKNHFLIQLPAVQEKLVDILRNVPSPLVQCEVYLCIRVLLCRLAAHSMTSFWPVILTELVRCACLNWHSKSNLNCSTEYLSK